jgi:tetratricopeptide (TPR) repeat protein
VSDAGWRVTSFDELDSIPVSHGLVWHPVRRKLGIRAFGTNAYTADRVGDQVVEEHDEVKGGGGAGGHEEMYVVVRGRATFTLDGETIDAPAGTLVFIRDPKVRRVAIAEEDGTLVLAVGGEAGQAYEASPWEWSFVAMPALRSGRWQEAIEILEDGLRERPGNASLLYNLACAEAGAGRKEDALAHLREAVEARPDLAERARADSDLDPIRGEPGFP